MPQGSRARASGLAAVTTRGSKTGARPIPSATTGPGPRAESSRPTDPDPLVGHPAARLRQLGLRPRRGLSQSFLVDAGVARAIVDAAELDPGRDHVLEVGPGLGILTGLLVRQAQRVVAVELDANLAQHVRAECPARNLTVHTGDILTLDPAAFFDAPYVVVANLPYHITSPVLRLLLAAGPPYVRRLVVMVQREVAERIAARPGKLSALAVGIQAQAVVRPVRVVAAGAFYPRPRVDSTVLALQPLPDAERAVPRQDVVAFTAFVHAGFAQPRKHLVNSLAQGLATDKLAALALLDAHGVDPTRRPQDLTITEWAALFRTFATGTG